jgi:hypothetical protein
VDEGDAHGLIALLRRELRLTPGRLGDCMRIVVVVLAVVAISETFRIPDIALSAYIVLFLSGREAAPGRSRQSDYRAHGGRRAGSDEREGGAFPKSPFTHAS